MSQDGKSVFIESRWDLWLGTILLLAGVFCLRSVLPRGFVIGSNSAARRLMPDTSSDGVLRERGWIRYRNADSPLWKDLGNEFQSVSEGDSIYTAEDGLARLKLRGTSVELEPRSLITIRTRSAGSPQDGLLSALRHYFLAPSAAHPVIRMESGRARVQLARESDPLEISLGDRLYRVTPQAESATLELSIADGELSSARLSTGPGGAVQLQAVKDGAPAMTSEVIAPDHAVELLSPVPSAAVSIPLKALAPAPWQRILTESPSGTSVRFQWQWLHPSSNERFELRVRGSGLSLSREITPSQRELSLPLPAGDFEWQLCQGRGAQCTFSTPWEHLALKHLLPPDPQGPIEGYTRTIDQDGESAISFSWKSALADLETELEVNREGEQAAVFQASLRGAGKTLPLKTGRYRWRVRQVTPEGLKSVWSAERTLQLADLSSAPFDPAESSRILIPVAGVSPTPSPAPLARAVPPPKKVEVIPALELAPGKASTKLQHGMSLDSIPLLIRWKPIEGVREYLLTLFGPGGREIMKKTLSSAEYQFEVKSTDSTEYSYTVTATLTSGTVIHSSRAPILIELVPPVPKKPENNTESNLRDPVFLSWESTALTAAYRLQISESADFHKPLRDQKLTENYSFFKAPQAGLYFWRVQGTNKSNSSRWSEVYRLRVR